MEIVTREHMKQIEENALQYDLTFHRLMENAGSAAAAFIRRTFSVSGRNCMVFCSKGNNGGDGLVAARKLSESGANVVVVLLDGIPTGKEAASMYNTASMMQIPIAEFSTQRQKVMDYLSQTDIIVDAICGTGFTGRLRDAHREACRGINSAIAAVIALDIPTGVECNTGAADPDAVQADFTVAFDRLKPAHVLPSSKSHCGLVETVEIGIPPEAHRGIPLWEAPAPALEILNSGSCAEPPAMEFASPQEDNSSINLQFVPASQEGDDPQLSFLSPDGADGFHLEFISPEEDGDEDGEGVEAPHREASQPEADSFAPSPAPPDSFAPPAVSPGSFAPPAATSPAGSLTLEQVFALLPPRPRHSHKGTFGRLLNFSGSQNFTGAAVLSTMAALRCGAGLVTLASTSEVCGSVGAHIAEATFLPLAKSAVGGIDFEGSLPVLSSCLKRANAVLIGCGLGNTAQTAQLLHYVLSASSCPIVVDADGINALSQNIHVLQKASAPVVLTPHTGEMARLSGLSIQEIEDDRQGAATRFAQEQGVVLVLKGPGTLIATPDGRLLQNQTGNPGLAKGGSGDLLAGMIGSLLAQGLEPRDAAACGVYLHGLAGDRCAKRRSQYAMLPSELLEDLAELFLENGR